MATEQKRTKDKKNVFLENHINQKRYVARTCGVAGISRWTFYNWMKKDPLFRSRVNDLEDRTTYKKEMFAEAWAKMSHKGTSDLCRRLEISRWSFYNWLKKDPAFWPSVMSAWDTERKFQSEYLKQKYPDWRN